MPHSIHSVCITHYILIPSPTFPDGSFGNLIGELAGCILKGHDGNYHRTGAIYCCINLDVFPRCFDPHKIILGLSGTADHSDWDRWISSPIRSLCVVMTVCALVVANSVACEPHELLRFTPNINWPRNRYSQLHHRQHLFLWRRSPSCDFIKVNLQISFLKKPPTSCRFMVAFRSASLIMAATWKTVHHLSRVSFHPGID